MYFLTLPLVERKNIAEDTVELTFDLGDKQFDFKPGQFVRVSLPMSVDIDQLQRHRDFSIASSPGAGYIKIAFRTPDPMSEFKRQVCTFPIGAHVDVSGPFGSMVLSGDPSQPLIFIAGGIGITAFKNKIEQIAEESLPYRVTVLWADRNEERAAYKEEIERAIDSRPEMSIHHIYGQRIDAECIAEHCDDLYQAAIQIAGMPEMVDEVRGILRGMSVASDQISYEHYRGSGMKRGVVPVRQETSADNATDTVRYQGLLEALNKTAIVSEADAEGAITFVNDMFIEVSKYSREELIGQNHRILMSHHHPPEFFEDLWRTISSGSVWRGEVKNRAKDGSYYWVDTSIAPILDDEGRPMKYVSVRFLINERKRVAGELRRYREQLEQLVEERTKELSSANIALKHEIARRKDLEEKLRSRADELKLADQKKDEFIAILSHELRNPLSPIVMSLDLAKMHGIRDAELVKYFDTIYHQINHMRRLLEDLLDVSRVMRGKIDLQMQDVDLAEIGRHAIDAVRYLVEEREQHLAVSLPEKAVIIQGDPARLEQIIVNLLTNAIKYTDEKGNISLSIHEDGDHVNICVRDTGIGIDPHAIDKLFALFEQADSSHARKGGGLGIGLALSQSLAQMHGGSITAHSEGVGKGSEFTLRLPRVRQEPKQISALESNDLASQGNQIQKVLVVDDVQEIADAMSKLLSRHGYEVATAYSGEEAVKKAREILPDIVFLDVAMPGMDGYATLQRLYALEELQETVFIAVTGFGQSSDLERSKKEGFHAHLTKPVTWQDIQHTIKKAE